MARKWRSSKARLLHGSVLHIIKWSAGTAARLPRRCAVGGHTTIGQGTRTIGPTIVAEMHVRRCACGPCRSLRTIIWRTGPADVKVGHDAKRGADYWDQATSTHHTTDSNSAPYYDYFNDIIYVGTDTANVHQFVYILTARTAAIAVRTIGKLQWQRHRRWPVLMNIDDQPGADWADRGCRIGADFRCPTRYGDLDYIETKVGPVTPGACSWQTAPP